ncbi:MAG: acyltransferase [Chloroflexaceae bacterium]|nr:acyltransferase [Chloroflexaceae bacterium]
MRWAGRGALGRLAMNLASWFAPPYFARRALARFHPRGYIAPTATLYHRHFTSGAHVFLGDRTLLYQDHQGGPIRLGDRVHLYGEDCLQTGAGGSIDIASDTHIQPRCQFSAYRGSIHIGSNVQIAPNCAFYAYAHEVKAGQIIREQPLVSKGGITIGDDVWLGCNVIVLDGAVIGSGAVIGAGAVVSGNIPPGAIAVGVPARVVKYRT